MEKLILTLCLVLPAIIGFSQDWSWEKRYEQAYYYSVRLKKDIAVQNTIQASNTITEEQYNELEIALLSNDSEAVFKIERISGNSIRIYHLSAMDKQDITEILTPVLQTADYTFGEDINYEFP